MTEKFDCLVIGNGPTFTENIDFYRNYDSFKIGCNGIIFIDFPIDLYILGDYALFKANEYQHLRKLPKYPEVLFRNDNTCSEYVNDIKDSLPNNISWFTTDIFCSGIFENKPGLYWQSHSVAMYMLQEALYRGYKNIALVGCDCCYAGVTELSPNYRKPQIARKFVKDWRMLKTEFCDKFYPDAKISIIEPVAMRWWPILSIDELKKK